MKALFILLALSSTANAWEIIKDKEDFFLVDKQVVAKEKVFAESARTPVEVVALSKDVSILRYLESKAGTKDITETYNCAVYNAATKKILTVDQLCKTVKTAVGGKKTTTIADFKLNADSVSYVFEELSDNFPLK